MIKLNIEEAEEPETKLPTSTGSKKQASSRKTSTSLLTMPQPLTVWITTSCGKFLRDGNTRPPDLFLRNLCAGQEATELIMEQTGSKSGKEYIMLYIVTLFNL